MFRPVKRTATSSLNATSTKNSVTNNTVEYCSDYVCSSGKQVPHTGFSYYVKNRIALLFALLGIISIGLIPNEANACSWSGFSGQTDFSYAAVPCNSFASRNVGSGTYTNAYLRNGINYTISTCGSSFDTQLTIFDQNPAWTQRAYNDDNGPDCSGNNASLSFTSTYTGRHLLVVNRYNCQGHDFSGVSAILKIRENLGSAPGTPSGGGTYCASSATLTRSGSPPTGYTWYWQNTSGGTSTSLGSGATFNATSSGTYYLRTRSDNGCWGNQSAGVTVTLQSTAGTSGTAGNGYWYVSAYNGYSFNTYYGYYTQNGYSWDSRTRWTNSPSEANASGGNAYQGCDIPVDNHSTRARRTNFACGYYRIDVPNHDDDVTVYVNGVQVFNHAGCCDSHTGVWYGDLDASSTVEIRHQEGGGGSHVGINVVNVTGTLSGGSVTGGGTGCVGANYGTFGSSANASGGSHGYTYQWQSSPNNSTWTDISGANATTYDPAALSATTYYRRRVIDGCGNTAYSNTLTITIVADPTISASGSTTVCVGGSASLTSSVSGGTGSQSYQWQSSPNNSTWTNISGATSASYNTGAVSSTTYYRVQRIANGTGCNDPYSNVLTVTVVADPSISTSGGGTVCVGGNLTLSSSTSGGTGTLGYQWQSSPNNSTWSNISGATASTYNTGALSTTTYYRVIRTATGSGCNNATSNVQTVTVVADPSISASGSATICVGGSVTFSSSTSGGTGTTSYQWQSSPNNSTWSNISGATGSTYTASGVTSTTYYRVVRSATGSGCGNATSNTVTATVVPDPSVSASGSTTICTGGNANLSSSASGGTGNTSYQWQVSSDNSSWSNVAGGTSSTLNTGAITSTLYYRVQFAASGSGCNTATSNTVTVTVVPDPSISASGSTTICVGGSASLSSSTSGGTGTLGYQWQSSPNNSTWSNISGATSATYNTGTLTSTTYYRVLRTASGSGCGTATSNTVTVTVNPDPTVAISGGTEICKYASTTLSSSVSGGTGTCSVQWQSGPSSSGPWTNVGTGSSYNTGSLSTTTYYRAVYNCTGNGCNTATSNVEQVLIDVTPPTAACKTISINLSAAGTASITAAALDNGSFDACSAVTFAASKTSFNCSNVGSNTVVLTVTDNNGNSATCNATVIVNDVTPPTASCKNITIDLDSAGQASITAADVDNGSNDVCGIASMSVSPNTFNCSSTGPNTVTLTVTDVNGNVSTCTSTVTVNDVLIPGIAPNVTCKGGTVTAYLDASGVAVVTPAMLDNGSYDNCGLALTVTPNTFDCSNIGGFYTVLLTGTDPAGNQAFCTSKVSIIDNLPPTMVCKTITIQLDASGSATIVAADVDGGSFDNCAMQSLSVSKTSFGCGDVGSNTVTLTGTDVNGNVATCTATVIVEDNVAPAAVCKSITLQLDASGNASITPADIDNGSNDACGIASLSLSKTTFDCSNVGANTVTLTVTDNNNNVSTCTATVTVEDNVAPQITCPANITVDTDPGVCTANVSVPAPTTSDACGIATTVNDYNGTANASGVYPLGTTTVTWTTTDVNGNASTCTMTVTVEDNEAPTITCPYDPFGLFRPVDAGQCYATINVPAPTTADNCGVASVVNDFTGTSNASGQYPLGVTTVTWTVTDNSGNTSTCQDFILVIDNINPTAACKNITLQLNSNGFASIVPGDLDNGSFDNCSISTMSLSRNTFSCADVGTNLVTLTVFDNSGNQGSCTATVTVVDNVAPLAACQDVTVFLDINGQATVAASQVNNGSSDACGLASVTVSPSSFTCANLGPNPVTLTVTDNNGNVSTCNATVTVVDNLDPDAICQLLTVYLDPNGNANITGYDVASGSTDNCSVTSIQVNPSSFNCSDLGANPVTVIVEDQSGNDDFCFSTVTVLDNTAPIIACSSDLMVNNDAGACGAVVNFNITATDNCSVASFGQTAGLAPGSQFPVGTTVVTYQATDGSGNVSTCSFNVTVVDNEVPQLSCAPLTIQLDANGNASIVPDDLSTSSDNCGIASKVLSKNTFDCSNIGTNSVVVTVTDVNGNVSSCTAVVTVEDNVAPVALCKAVTVQLDANGNGSITTADVDNGSNDACGIASLSLSKTSFDCSNVGANTVTLTVTDNNGNISTCTATVTVEDNVAPVALCKAVTVQLDANGNGSITTADVDNGSNDACGIASLSLNKTSFDCSEIGTNTVTLTVTDNNGNVSTCNATITVEDNVAPVALCKAVTVQLDANGNGSITTADVDNGSNDACGIASLSLSKTTFDCSNVGANTVTLTVTDNNGNVSTCTSTVTVEDNIAPVALCQNIVVVLDAAGNASITATDLDNGSTDACGIANYSINQSTFDCSNVGPNAVTLTLTDVNGNVASCTPTVFVYDTTAPVAICQSITIQLDANGSASITTADIDNGSNDACGIASLSLDKTSFDCSNVGANTVTLTVTDNNGNVSTCTATVTVEDNVAPVALCKAVTVQLDANGNGSITTADVDNGSNDACGIASLSLNKTTFDCSEVGANTVTLTVTDNNGNVSTCTSTITVEDNVAPVALCKAVTVQLDANGNGSITPADVDNGSNDACGIASLSLSKTTFDCSEVGANTVTLTVTDNNGNVSTCTSTITVEDNVAPIALCKAVTVQLDANGNGSITTADVDNGSNDACGIASLSLSKTTFDCSEVGANTVTLTVTDNNGNVSTCTATVTVEDNVAPQITCPASITVNNDAGICGAVVVYTLPVGTDACAVTTTQTDGSGLTSGSVFPVGTTTQSFEVVDASGNTANCSFTVTVIDNEQPAITCPANISVVADSNDCDPQVFWTAPVPTDNCQVASVTSNFNPGDEFYLGTHTVTYNVVDIYGNTNTCSFNITVSPKPETLSLSSPTFACGYNVSCNGNADGSIQTSVAGGCLPYSYSWSTGATTADISGLTAGTYSVTVTTADGQTATATYTVTEPALLTATATPSLYPGGTNISCTGFNDGSIDIEVLGGCAPYTYSWNGPNGFTATTQDISNLYAGTYKVRILDANNCSRVVTTTLTEATPIVVDSITSPTYAGGYNIGCNGSASGNIDLSVSGAVAPYTYAWSNGATTEDLNGVGAGTYTVTVTDVNGCSVVGSITLTEPPLLVFDACPDQDVVFGYYPENVAQITTFTGGGVPPYTYAWSTGETGTSIVVAPAATTTYTVTITDANGCQSVKTHTVNVTDIRCGSKLEDVTMCDGNKVKCVKPNDVPRRISKYGWTLGPCGSNIDLNAGTCEEPTIPGCACVDGVSSITFQYNGPSGVTVDVYNKKNQTDLLASFGNVQNGDQLTVLASAQYGGRFDKELFVNAQGVETTIKTDCKYIEVGASYGNYTIVEYTDVMNNTCNAGVASCACDDNITILQFVYRGQSGATIRVWEDRQLTKLVNEFVNVQQGDTLMVNGTLIQPTGKLNKETYFELVGSASPVIVINTDCKIGGTVGRIYGDYFLTGYIDKKDNTCNMPTPCPCLDGIAHVGFIYNGQPNGTMYAFLKNDLLDTLGVYTNLQPGDTIIVSAAGANKVKLENLTYLQDANTGDVTTVTTACKSYIEGQFFGAVTVFGFVDSKGTRCHMDDPSECDCEGGLVNIEVEYDKYDSTSLTNATIYAFANSTHADTIATFTGVDAGDILFIDGSSLPGGTLSNFTYLKIAGSTGPDIKIPTGCQYPIVGSFIREAYIVSYVDSMGNVCEDACGPGKTLMCHSPANRAPHTHCVKTSDVASKLAQGDWTLGACPILKTNDDEVTLDADLAGSGIELSAFPNPFNNFATFKFTVPNDDRVTLTIYSTTGSVVTRLFNGEAEGGKEYTVELDATDLALGMYYYQFVTGDGKTYSGKVIHINR